MCECGSVAFEANAIVTDVTKVKGVWTFFCLSNIWYIHELVSCINNSLTMSLIFITCQLVVQSLFNSASIWPILFQKTQYNFNSMNLFMVFKRHFVCRCRPGFHPKCYTIFAFGMINEINVNAISNFNNRKNKPKRWL